MTATPKFPRTWVRNQYEWPIVKVRGYTVPEHLLKRFDEHTLELQIKIYQETGGLAATDKIAFLKSQLRMLNALRVIRGEG